jgi:hypothetical protein
VTLARPRRPPARPRRRRHRPSGAAGARLALLALGLALAAAPPAAAWELRDDAPPAAFEEFHRRFGFAAYPFPRHGAAPLGLVGFEVWADAAVDQDFDDQSWSGLVLAGDLPAGLLTVGRVGVRKGLPGGIDLGASYGRALGSDVELAAVELSWAVLDGGAVSPAFGLRAVAARTLSDDPYELEQYGVEALLSKGFTVLTPYVGAGAYHSEGSLARSEAAGGGRLDTDESRGYLLAGATLNLLLPKLTVEVEQGETFQAALRVAFGF